MICDCCCDDYDFDREPLTLDVELVDGSNGQPPRVSLSMRGAMASVLKEVLLSDDGFTVNVKRDERAESYRVAYHGASTTRGLTVDLVGDPAGEDDAQCASDVPPPVTMNVG